jgi:predicted RNA-binding protein with PIN domain
MLTHEMPIHIIIDGYNLIRQSTTLSRLDQQDIMLGRDALVDMLAAYRKIKPHRITVVFDGHHGPAFSQQRDQKKGIAIRFSRGGESADDLIKRMAFKEKEKALVVSSDQEVADSAAANGAATISAPQFEGKIGMAVQLEWPFSSRIWKSKPKIMRAGPQPRKKKAPPADFPKNSVATE